MRIPNHSVPHPDNSSELEIFTARSGMPSARVRRKEGVFHIHSSVKPEDEARCFEGMTFWGDLIVFLGTGLGYHVRPYLKDIPSHCRLLLVDYYPLCVEQCRENMLHDIPNTIYTISSSATDWRAKFGEARSGAETIQIIRHPASYRINKGYYDSLNEALAMRMVGKSEDNSVLLLYGNFFLEEELRSALDQNGNTPALFRYKEYSSSERFESMLSQLIQKKRPRFLLSVNMKGFDSQGIVGEVASRFGIPVVVWFVDDPHPILLSQKSFIRNHFIACSWERTYLPWLFRQGFGSCHYLPLAGDPALFPLAASEKPLRAEIGFVGSSMGKSFLDDVAARFLWSKELEPIVSMAAKTLCADRNVPINKAIEQACRSLGKKPPFSDDKNTTWLHSYAIHYASMLNRQELVGACIPLGINLFGDIDGWKELFGNVVAVHPDVDYRTQLSHVYRSIGININMTSLQMPRTVNQRVFDVPLCGGFVLTDHQADLDDLFERDEIAVYHSKEELVDRLVYFRSHTAERDAISHKARHHILSAHTYVNRLESLITFF